MDKTDEKLRTETRRVNLVDRKSASCGKRERELGSALASLAVHSAVSFPRLPPGHRGLIAPLQLAVPFRSSLLKDSLNPVQTKWIVLSSGKG